MLLESNIFGIIIVIILIFYFMNLVYMEYKIHKKLCLIVTVPIEQSKNYYSNLKTYLSKINEYKNNKLKVVVVFYKKNEVNKLGFFINTAILLNPNSDYYAIHDYASVPVNVPDLLYTDYPIFTYSVVKDCNDCYKKKNPILIVNKEDLINTNGLPNKLVNNNLYETFKEMLKNNNDYHYVCSSYNSNNCSADLVPYSVQYYTRIISNYYSKLHDIKKDLLDDITNFKTNLINLIESHTNSKKFVYTSKHKNNKIVDRVENNDYLHNDGLDQIDFEKINIKSNQIKDVKIDLTQIYISNVKNV